MVIEKIVSLLRKVGLRDGLMFLLLHFPVASFRLYILKGRYVHFNGLWEREFWQFLGYNGRRSTEVQALSRFVFVFVVGV